MMKKWTKVWELAAALGAVLLLLAGLAAVVATPSPWWLPVVAGNDQGPSPQALDWLDERYVNEGQPDAVTGAMISDGSVGIGDVSPEVQAFLSNLESRLTAVEQQLAGTPTPTPTPPPGLVGFWPFSEGSGTITADASGQGGSATLLPSGNGPLWTAGKVGFGLDFDGVDDCLEIPGASQLNFTASDFSIELWIKPTAPLAHGQLFTMGKPFADGYYLQMKVDGSVRLWTDQAGVFQQTWSVEIAQGGIWQHIVATRQGPVGRIYRNGYEVSYFEQGNHVNPVSSARTAKIGCSDSFAENFDGVIDQVAVWNRALTPQEVLARFQNP